MSRRHEVVSLHIGQAGCQIGEACWDTFRKEHIIDADGTVMKPKTTEGAKPKVEPPMAKRRQTAEDLEVLKRQLHDDGAYHALFMENGHGKYTPRALFADTDPLMGCMLRNSEGLKELLAPEQIVTGKKDTAGNYVRGNYTLGRDLCAPFFNSFRRLAESCDTLSEVHLYHSIGGGTGSGVTMKVLEELHRHYPGVRLLTNTVAPSPQGHGGLPNDCYNAVCALSELTEEHATQVRVFDNAACYALCTYKYGIASPSYTDVNRLIASFVSNTIAPMRFGGLSSSPPDYAQNDADALTSVVNGIPYPRIKFVIPTYGEQQDFSIDGTPSLSSLAKGACLGKDALVSIGQHGHFRDHPESFVPVSRFKSISNHLFFRGRSVHHSDVMAALLSVKTTRAFLQVDWDPTAFKVSMCSLPPLVSSHRGRSPKTKKDSTAVEKEEDKKPGEEERSQEAIVSLSGILNHGAITEVFERVSHKFDLLYAKRGHVHSYVGEGLESGFFSEAREQVASILKDYEEVVAESTGDFDDDDDDDY